MLQDPCGQWAYGRKAKRRVAAVTLGGGLAIGGGLGAKAPNPSLFVGMHRPAGAPCAPAGCYPNPPFANPHTAGLPFDARRTLLYNMNLRQGLPPHAIRKRGNAMTIARSASPAAKPAPKPVRAACP